MQFKRMLLMCSALITLAYSFPTGTQQNTTATLSQNETVLDAKKIKTPLVIIMEKKDPKSESVVIEFVYTSNGDNSIVPSTGTNKDKYVVDNPVHKEKPELKSNSSEKEKEKLVQTLNTGKADLGEINEPKPDATKVQMMTVTSLTPEEVSPISGKWPKYFYDAFNPVQPFPELLHGKSNQINTEKAVSESGDTYLPYYEKERKESPYVAGPQLNPLSIYNREFNVPIFD